MHTLASLNVPSRCKYHTNAPFLNLGIIAVGFAAQSRACLMPSGKPPVHSNTVVCNCMTWVPELIPSCSMYRYSNSIHGEGHRHNTHPIIDWC